jgi:hypothetical protein
MGARKLLISGVVVSAWLASISAAGAHRVDEYLQATRLSVDITHVDLEIDLTAGIALASEVFGSIDTDRDGEISSAEGETYARQVLGAVVLSVDGRPAPISLVDARFPQFREMSLGVGTIRLRASAKIPATTGHHQISFRNMHRPDASVYLVNALVPANPRIQLGDPRRDRVQQGLTLDYTVAADPPPVWFFALIIGLVVAGRFLLRERPRWAARALNLRRL